MAEGKGLSGMARESRSVGLMVEVEQSSWLWKGGFRAQRRKGYVDGNLRMEA